MKFDYTCEILVVGLGTAGAIAAISTGKRGHDVIGVDISPIPGGVGTSACVWDYYYGARGGLYDEVNSRADSLIAAGYYMNTTHKGFKKSYPTTVKALALEEELDAAGVRCFYSSIVTDVFTDGGKIVGAAFLSDRGMFTVGAECVIDGAEGEVARLAGIRDLGGRKYDNHTARFSRTIGYYEGEGENRQVRGIWVFCGQFAGLDGAEASREILRWTADPPILRDDYKGSKRLAALGCETAKREVFCYETEEVYTFRDYLDKNKTPENIKRELKHQENAIFYTFAPLDNSTPEFWFEDEDFQDWQGLCDMHAYGYTTAVTPGMLIAKEIPNLLLAGKHIGTGHTMSAGVRMRTDMEKCGEAAGVMASLAAERKIPASDLSPSELREILSKTKCYDKSNDRGVCDLNDADETGMCATVKLPATVPELRECLSSIHPAPGLFAVRTGVIKADDALVSWLSEGGLLSENSAVALGLLGDSRCLPVLREILSREPENYTYYSRKRYFFPWIYSTDLCNYVKAACLVSRFNDPADRALIETLAAYDGDEKKRQKAAGYALVALGKK